MDSSALAATVLVNPEILGGIPRFAGTRVPVQALLDHLEKNATLDQFLEGFPSATRQQAISYLELSKNHLLECVSS
jgi:uncharacterized protein (DUF433 family)